MWIIQSEQFDRTALLVTIGIRRELATGEMYERSKIDDESIFPNKMWIRRFIVTINFPIH